MMVTKRILLVDQEPQITLLVRQALEKAGNYSVREERAGELALQAAREFRPDLILVDLIAEGADGDYFTKQFHTDVILRNTPVVCLSSLRSEESVGSSGFLATVFRLLRFASKNWSEGLKSYSLSRLNS